MNARMFVITIATIGLLSGCAYLVMNNIKANDVQKSYYEYGVRNGQMLYPDPRIETKILDDKNSESDKRAFALDYLNFVPLIFNDETGLILYKNLFNHERNFMYKCLDEYYKGFVDGFKKHERIDVETQVHINIVNPMIRLNSQLIYPIDYKPKYDKIIQFTQDGKLLFCSNRKGYIWNYDVGTWDVNGRIKPNPIPVSIALSKSGKCFASQYETELKVYDDKHKQDGLLLSTESMGNNIANALTFTNNEGYLIGAFNGGQLLIWDTTNWKAEKVSIQDCSDISRLAVNGKDDKIVILDKSNNLFILDLKTRNSTMLVKAPELITRLIYNPSNQLCISCDNQVIYRYNENKWEQLLSARAPFAISADNKYICARTVKDDKNPFDVSLKVWSLVDGKDVMSIPFHSNKEAADLEPEAVAFSNDSQYVAVDNTIGHVEIWKMPK